MSLTKEDLDWIHNGDSVLTKNNIVVQRAGPVFVVYPLTQDWYATFLESEMGALVRCVEAM